jgi:competence protein ComEC
MASAPAPQLSAPRGGVLGWLGWRPLLLVCAALIVGVALGDCLPASLLWALLLGAAAALSAALAGRLRKKWADGALMAASLAAGAAWYVARSCPAQHDIGRYAPARPTALLAAVADGGAGGRPIVCHALQLVPFPGATPLQVEGFFVLRSRPAGQLATGAVIRLEQPILRPWRPRTNPWQYSPALQWQRRRVWCYAQARHIAVLERPRAPSLADWAAALRNQLTRRLELAMPGHDPQQAARLLAAIVYGASLSDLPEETLELYRRTGTIHVLVVSGTQVSFLVLVLLTLTGRRRRLVRPGQLAVLLPAIFFYTTLCGAEPSVTRAALMGAILVLGLYGGRTYDLATALAAVAAVLVVAEPADLFAPSLQLTFAACVGVVGAARLLPPHLSLPRPLAWTAYALLGTAGAWVMTAPLLAYHFGGLPLTGSLANALVVPAAELALLLGLSGLLLACWHPLTGAPLLGAARLLLRGSAAVNRGCSQLPAAYLPSVRLNLPLAAAWYLAVLGCYLLFRFGGRAWRGAASVAGPLALGLLLVVAAYPTPPAHPTVTWLDVGEGLCTVIETPARQFVLFDAGSRDPDLSPPRAARDVILPYLQSRGCRRLTALVVSHADLDHFSAVPTLLEYLPAERLIVCPYGHGKQYEGLLETARAHGLRVEVASAGAVLELAGARLHFLHPPPYPLTGTGSDDNNNCLVAALETPTARVLLTADLEVAGQQELLRCTTPNLLPATALQVPHHGRHSAYWPAFLDAAHPQWAVVPCGPEYVGGAPTPAFAAYLKAQGGYLLKTSEWGAVTLALRPGRPVLGTFLRRPRRLPD